MGRVAALLVVFLSFLLAACGDREGEPAGKAAPRTPAELVRGHYLFAHEVRALRPCGKDEDRWVIDPSGLLAELHGKLAGAGAAPPRIFVLAIGSVGPAPADGFGADYPGAVTVDEVVYAAAEGFGCDFDPRGFHYRASGTEPFWLAEAREGGLRLVRPGHPDLTWSAVTRQDEGDTVVLRGGEGPETFTLRILPTPGFDAMSGAYHHRSARFELDGTVYQGVALRGLATGF